jgi:hypothetical protein
MSPRAKILTVVGGVMALNMTLAVLLLVIPAPTHQGATSEAPAEPTSTAAVLGTTTPLAGAVPADVERDASTASTPDVGASRAMGTPAAASAAASPEVYVVPVDRQESVLAAMEVFAAASDTFAYTSREYPGLGSFVLSIGGRMSGNGFDWILYVNGTQASAGASTVVVRPGDRVEWRFERDMW